MKIEIKPGRSYAEIAAAQRRSLREAADRLERGQPLTENQAALVAAAARAYADRIPDTEPKGRGNPVRKLIPAKVFLERYSGKTIDQLSEQYGVSDSAIKQATEKARPKSGK